MNVDRKWAWVGGFRIMKAGGDPGEGIGSLDAVEPANLPLLA